MPNAKVLSEKQAIVETLTARIKSASAGVFVDYKGITVEQDTALRTEMRREGVDYSVVKNTLVHFAINNAGYSELDNVLNGTTSLATATGDPITPFRILNDYSKKLNDKFNIKAAFMDGQILTEAEITELASLPSKEALISVVLGTMLAPITSLAVVLDQIAKKDGEAAAEVPAAE
ncbi:MAG: 50S ribosomal protein L10 [Oscillospiraceae bacterium]|nr:50S ribosomal protein L10 [Oscillospiraceae bacterium]